MAGAASQVSAQVPSQDAATNTGGVKAPRVPTTKAPKRLNELTLQHIVHRMRVSYPALRAAKVDSTLQQMVLAELISQCHNEATEVVVPEGAKLQTVSRETYQKYREMLSGLTEQNLPQVTGQLIQLGLTPGAGRMATV